VIWQSARTGPEGRIVARAGDIGGITVNDIDWVQLLTSFEGRINRAKYWAGAVAIWVVVMVALFVSLAVDNLAIYVIVAIAIIWPGLALAVKRWHDRGKSGWWVLIALVPLVGQIWAFVEVGFLVGDQGPNEYGPDPLAA